jgi:nucleoside-diphosphate-sugar epimerase
VLPVPPDLRLQAVHTEDVADAYARALLQRATGAFNVAADPVLDGPTLATVLGARQVPVDWSVLRRAARLAFAARLQPTEPGWIDLARQAPVLDCTRVRVELGWQPAFSATEALRDLLAGMAEGRGTASPAMRPREPVHRRLGRALRSGGAGTDPTP